MTKPSLLMYHILRSCFYRFNLTSKTLVNCVKGNGKLEEGKLNVHHCYCAALIVLLVSTLLFLNVGVAEPNGLSYRVTVYVNEGCSCCIDYLGKLKEALIKAGISEIEVKYTLENKSNRLEQETLYNKLGIPLSERTGFIVNVNDKYFFEGHPPIDLVINFLLHEADRYPTLIITQGKTHDWKDAETYTVIFTDFKRKCPSKKTITECLQGTFQLVEKKTESNKGNFLGLIVFSGLVDGINPCAFSILVLFILSAFTAAFRLIRKHGEELVSVSNKIIKFGGTFILGVFLAYLALGLGVIQTVKLIPVPHLAAKISSIMILLLVVINLKSFIFPKTGFFNRLIYKPLTAMKTAKELARKGSVPLSFIAGILTGICTLPCSGGVYIAVLSLIAAEETFIQGLIYLIIYNMAYIAPLLIVLLAASNRELLTKIWKWRIGKNVRLYTNIVTLVVALTVLYISWTL